MTAASPAVNLLPLAGWDISTLGWQGNMIYDIPNFLARRAVHVSATQVQVRCFDIPNATQTTFNDTSGTYFFQIDLRVEDVEIAPSKLVYSMVDTLSLSHILASEQGDLRSPVNHEKRHKLSISSGSSLYHDRSFNHAYPR